MTIRCAWVPKDDALYVRYHDEEWGVPVHDDQHLFEMLCLEGAQAGLSWRTVLQRREGYRAVFANFEAAKIARFSDERLERILRDERIVRNRLKVLATRENARAYLALCRETSLDELLWSVVGGAPIQNRWKAMGEVPAVTAEAQEMSRVLKKRGFRFVGPTICYAFMQAVGMVNDHLATCFRHAPIRDLAAARR